MNIDLKAMATDALRTAAACAIGMVIAAGSVFDINGEMWRGIAAAAIAAALAVVLRYIQPGGDYGRQAGDDTAV